MCKAFEEIRQGDILYGNSTNDSYNFLEKQQNEVRKMILIGLDQVKAGKTKDFDEVCDRLEKKYRDLEMDN